LRDRVDLAGNIGIVVADQTLFTTQELHAIEKETQPIAVRHPQIPIDLLDILRFVHRQNGFGIQPKYVDIQRFLGVSKPTTRKRIQVLIDQGYVQEFARGSRKCLQLSYGGIQLITRQ
jgi:uncharacterized membrane protein